MVTITNETNLFGTTTNEYFGNDCKLSHDGKVIATINGSDATAKVYKDVNGTWTQQGPDIDILTDVSLSTANNGYNSIDVSYYNDVIRVAIAQWGASSSKGVVAVYEYNGTTWDMLGSEFVGEANNVRLGLSISLNKYGNVLALGNYNTSGTSSYSRTLTYFWSDNNSTWYNYGIVNPVTDYNSNSISKVELSNDGKRLIVGQPIRQRAQGGELLGTARTLYHNDSNNTWVQISGKNEGANGFINAGYVVGISGDGNYAYFYCRSDDGTSGRIVYYSISESGAGTVYTEDVDYYITDLNSVSATSYSGDYFALSHSYSSSTPGTVSYYNFNKDTTTFTNTDITGSNNNDRFGIGLSMNDTGDMLIVGIGKVDNDLGTSQAGAVGIYSVDGITLDVQASGDPYLRNMYGEVMKLPDANQDYTMIETKNGDLKVDITTTLLNDIQKAQYWNNCKKYFPQLADEGLYNQNLLNTFSADICFIRYVDVTYMGKHERYDLFKKLTDVKEINDEDNGMGVEKELSFMVDNKEVLVKLQKFDNPQIVSGVSYKIPSRLQVNGLVTETDMMKYNMITEEYVTSNGNRNVTMKHLQL